MDANQKNHAVCRLIAQGQKDLWNARVQGIVGDYALEPMREYFIDPCLSVSRILLPPLVDYFPSFAPIIVGSLNCQLYLLRLLFPITPIASHDLRTRAVNDLRMNTRSLPQQLVPNFKPPDDISSAFRGAVAFTVSVLADVVSIAMDQRKMNKWWRALIDFKGYLDASGVGAEWDDAIAKPLLGGRLFDNLKILHDIQLDLYAGRCEKIDKMPTHDVRVAVQEGKRYMRFATAAYGTEMVRSALDREAFHHEVDDNQKAIAFHCGISVDDIKILCVDDGGDMKVLRHFVAVDHSTQSVALALRGTLSISGALVDIQAMDAPFHGCRAHKGMAEMAENVWECSGEKIQELFKDKRYEDYSLIIIGHSLGAGTACLLHLKVHGDGLLPGQTIRCFGFAPPPTVAMEDSKTNRKLARAVENTICFVHDNDCVPFLSVSCVRRLTRLLDTVDDVTQNVTAYRRFRLFWGWDPLPAEIVQAVRAADHRDNDHEDTVRLSIPAKFVVWMKKKPGASPHFDAFGCLPQDFAKENIFICEDLLSDHLVEPYEDALDDLADRL